MNRVFFVLFVLLASTRAEDEDEEQYVVSWNGLSSVARNNSRVADPRHYQTILRYPGGSEFFVLGGVGSNNETKGDLWSYNGNTQKWIKGEYYEHLHRFAHSSILLNGTMIVAGGKSQNATLDDIWTVEQPSNMSRLIGSLPEPLYGHSIHEINNTLVVFGGIDANETASNRLYLFQNGSWIQVEIPTGNSSWPSPRAFHAALASEGSLSIFGGKSEENPAMSDAWVWIFGQKSMINATLSTSPPARHSHSMVETKAGILLYGGTNGNQTFEDYWVFTTKGWIKIETKAPAKRYGHSLLPQNLTHIYLFGGNNDIIDLNDVWFFVLGNAPQRKKLDPIKDVFLPDLTGFLMISSFIGFIGLLSFLYKRQAIK
eukprot:TRINITY_DN2253_c0_g1_i1.p1 TRINITY_DN2253_c0_g1~~TRINITY_DN2253_c0_g1_i1.p1  ORF type:complete len:388 (-),score=80.43 TRINITY_DN2253_c0_g1_i1:51-1166(-)